MCATDTYIRIYQRFRRLTFVPDSKRIVISPFLVSWISPSIQANSGSSTQTWDPTTRLSWPACAFKRIISALSFVDMQTKWWDFAPTLQVKVNHINEANDAIFTSQHSKGYLVKHPLNFKNIVTQCEMESVKEIITIANKMLCTQMNPGISYSNLGLHHQSLPSNVEKWLENIVSLWVQGVNYLAELSAYLSNSNWKKLATVIYISYPFLDVKIERLKMGVTPGKWRCRRGFTITWLFTRRWSNLC